MDKNDLIKRLKSLIHNCETYYESTVKVEGDPDDWHREADSLLLQYINDKQISDLFDKIEKWYS